MHSSSSFPLSQLHKLHFWRVALAFYLYVIPLRAAADCPRPVSVPISNCTTQPHGVVNTSADTWGLLISVGSPPQELCVSPSTCKHSFAGIIAPIQNEIYHSYQSHVPAELRPVHQ
jgi:hypothetical protein